MKNNKDELMELPSGYRYALCDCPEGIKCPNNNNKSRCWIIIKSSRMKSDKIVNKKRK